MVVPINTRLMATTKPPESVYTELLAKLERAGETMKEAVQSRLTMQTGSVSTNTKASVVKAEPTKVEEEAVVEADKRLENAVAEVKQAAEGLEEKLGAEAIGTESPVKTAVTELETAVADLNQAVTSDEAGSTTEAEKSLATAESELEAAITDVEAALDSEPGPVAATATPEPEGEVIEATTTAEPEGESVVVASESTQPEDESLVVTASTGAEIPVEEAASSEPQLLVASAESIEPKAEVAPVTLEAPVAFETDAEGGTLLDSVADTVASSAASILEASGTVIDSLSAL